MSSLTKQVQEVNENSVKIQDTVHSAMTSAASQQTAATTAPIQNKPVNNQHLYQVPIDGVYLNQNRTNVQKWTNMRKKNSS